MKSIKIYLLPLLLFIFFNTQVFSQNDFYNEKEKIKVEQKMDKTDSILVHGYFTEKDYNELHSIKKNQKSSDTEFYYGDEAHREEERRKRERNDFFGEVAAEVIVEVVVHAVFIFATFWH